MFFLPGLFPITSGLEFTHIYSVFLTLSSVFGNYHDYLPRDLFFDSRGRLYRLNIYGKNKNLKYFNKLISIKFEIILLFYYILNVEKHRFWMQ